MFLLQQPPSPWMSQRAPLDVNIGKHDTLLIKPYNINNYGVINIVLVQLMWKGGMRWTEEPLINPRHR